MLLFHIQRLLCRWMRLTRLTSVHANHDGRPTTLWRYQHWYRCPRFDYLYAYRQREFGGWSVTESAITSKQNRQRISAECRQTSTKPIQKRPRSPRSDPPDIRVPHAWKRQTLLERRPVQTLSNDLATYRRLSDDAAKFDQTTVDITRR